MILARYNYTLVIDEYTEKILTHVITAVVFTILGSQSIDIF